MPPTGATDRTVCLSLTVYTSKVYNSRVAIHRVVLTPAAVKDLERVPKHVQVKLQAWVDAVGTQGLEAVRKVPGFHDEPLKGRRQGQRSIRLSRAYRAIYAVAEDGAVEFVRVEEVNKHDY